MAVIQPRPSMEGKREIPSKADFCNRQESRKTARGCKKQVEIAPGQARKLLCRGHEKFNQFSLALESGL
jgi:hypothetical protein